MAKKGIFSNLFTYLIGYLVAAIALFPIFWMFVAGFKSKIEVLSTPFRFFPKDWLVANYTNILKDPAFTKTMLVTFIGAIIFAALLIIVASMAAFVFARLEFPFKRTLWVCVIFTMFIP